MGRRLGTSLVCDLPGDAQAVCLLADQPGQLSWLPHHIHVERELFAVLAVDRVIPMFAEGDQVFGWPFQWNVICTHFHLDTLDLIPATGVEVRATHPDEALSANEDAESKHA